MYVLKLTSDRSAATPIRLTALRLAALLCAVVFGGLMSAAPLYAEDMDPPDRVARLSFIKGEVLVQLADTNDWVPARVNRPVINNDQLWTGDGARAELQVGGSAVQIDENTQLTALEISGNVLQLQLTQGTVNVYVRGMERGDTIEVDTPNAAAVIQEPGTYRIAAEPSGDATVVQVRRGSAEVSGERQNFALREDEQVVLRGDTRLAAQFDQLGRLDDFDRWADARNRRGDRVLASQYVSTDVVGYEDLDEYGSWSNEPDYGQVWIPTRVVSGWSPYRYGHWEWIPPWGWTWIDDAPWGFAPFHYGRWAYTRDRWCWVPGPRAVRAVYAPALVTWVGTPGLNVAVSVNTAPVGWIPLGPREIYRPAYRVSPGYVERVNISNSLVRRDDFERRFREPPHQVQFVNRTAVTVVSANTFRAAQPVSRNLVRSDVRQLRPIDAAPNIRPERAALVGGERPLAPPPRIITREIVARRAPTPMVRADGPQTSVAPRNNIRVVEPPTPRRPAAPFGNERRDITSENPPANGQGPGRSFTRPAPDNVAPLPQRLPPNRLPNQPRDPNSRDNDDGRASGIDNDRGVRRGFTVPRAETPNVEQPNNIEQPSAPRPVAPRALPPQVVPHQDVRPQSPHPPIQREVPSPEPRPRAAPPEVRQPQRELPVQPTAPRQEAHPQSQQPQFKQREQDDRERRPDNKDR